VYSGFKSLSQKRGKKGLWTTEEHPSKGLEFIRGFSKGWAESGNHWQTSEEFGELSVRGHCKRIKKSEAKNRSGRDKRGWGDCKSDVLKLSSSRSIRSQDG